jgi:hypothetical protein
MNANRNTGNLPFDRPAIYQISVQGLVPDNWLDRLEGLRVTVIDDRAAPPLCMLVGELQDQIALASVLNIVHDLHLSVLSLSRFEVPPETPA